MTYFSLDKLYSNIGDTMKKRFVTRKKISLSFLKISLLVIIAIISFFYTIKLLFKTFIKVNDENRINEMLAISTNNLIGNISFLDLVNFNLTKPESLLRMNLSGVKNLKYEIPKDKETVKELGDPLVYIYNTHQTEEYSAGNLASYNITPTVYMASNILKKTLINKGINAVVEDENIKEVLNKNGWNYNDSYYASKLWLDNSITKYPTLKYFIDVHRDSASGTVTINDKVYAKMMVVIGMAHEHYLENESLMLKINDYLNTNYAGIMRTPFYGKRSQYNQDFNINTILIEIGGPDNTIDEIYNSTLVLGEAIASVIGGI